MRPSKQNLTAILIDDNRQMMSVMRSMLHSYGIDKIHDFASAEDAFPALRAEHVDIVLVDLELSGQMDGLLFSRLLRHDKDIYNPCVPVILMTGFASQSLITKAINSGVDDMVTRPLSARDLHTRVDKVLNFPRSYIRTPSGYFGPDRRRRIDPFYVGPERRIEEMAHVVNGATALKAPVKTEPMQFQDLKPEPAPAPEPEKKAPKPMGDVFFLD